MAGISIYKIKEDEFSFKHHDLEKVDPQYLELQYALEFEWNIEESLFFVILKIEYYYNKNGEDLNLSKLITTTGFRVDGIEKKLKIVENGFELPDEYILTFVSTALSAARGMLSYKLAGTILADYYLPLINVKDFLSAFGEVEIKASKTVTVRNKKL